MTEINIGLDDEGAQRHAHDLAQRLLTAVDAHGYTREFNLVVREVLAGGEAEVATKVAYLVHALRETAVTLAVFVAAEKTETKEGDPLILTRMDVLLSVEDALEKRRRGERPT